MQDYSIRYLDSMGCTLTTDLMSFANRADATDFAREVQPDHAIVEVWREHSLVIRLFRNPPAELGAGLDPPALALAAFSKADVLAAREPDGKIPAPLAMTMPVSPARGAGDLRLISSNRESPFSHAHVNGEWGPMPPPRFIP